MARWACFATDDTAAEPCCAARFWAALSSSKLSGSSAITLAPLSRAYQRIQLTFGADRRGARPPFAEDSLLRRSVHREERQGRDSSGEIEPGLTLEGKGLQRK